MLIDLNKWLEEELSFQMFIIKQNIPGRYLNIVYSSLGAREGRSSKQYFKKNQ